MHDFNLLLREALRKGLVEPRELRRKERTFAIQDHRTTGGTTKSLLSALDSLDEDHAAAVAKHQQRVASQRRCLIDPRTSRWLPLWDVVTMCALLVTAAYTPFEVAFVPLDMFSPQWIMNRVLDVVFTADSMPSPTAPGALPYAPRRACRVQPPTSSWSAARARVEQ